MTQPEEQRSRVAVLIDCDNISYQLASSIVAETSVHGTLSIKRAYGDWGSPLLSSWREVLPEHAIQPRQQTAHVAGKNASDFALVIEAMDLLYSGTVDTFCIVSSDSDFTSLAVRLRESGKSVYGLGRKTTSASFRNACDRFTYLEILGPDFGPSGAATEGPRSVDAEDGRGRAPAAGATSGSDKASGALDPPDLEPLLRAAIVATARDDGWAILARVGWYIVSNDPSFDSRNYGFARLGLLVRSLDFLTTREVPLPQGNHQTWIKLVT
ncbi:NYN domain-containing protein [Nocardioides aurantiacus]|uniref:NYN domain-containing protein n=1 Tax=Nocardioides aurantiacus TaxID=86796 RepID=UPI00403F9C26